MSQSVDDI